MMVKQDFVRPVGDVLQVASFLVPDFRMLDRVNKKHWAAKMMEKKLCRSLDEVL